MPGNISDNKKSITGNNHREQNFLIDPFLINDTAILKSLVESTSDLIFSVDNSYNYTSFNTTHKQRIKAVYNINISIGDCFLAPLSEADKQSAKESFDTTLAGESLKKIVLTSDHSGNRIFLDVMHNPIRDINNKIIGVSVVARDITVQKSSYEKVKQLSQAVEQSPVTILITDTSGTIEYVNNKGVEITGYQRNELIGKNPRILSTGEKSKQEYKELWDTIISGKTWKGEFHNIKKNGEMYWESATISPIQNEYGEIEKFLGVKEDITDRKFVEKELIQAKEKAEEINRIKNAFLSNMSHELRTPLVGILGFADILENLIEDVELKSMASSILSSGKRLLNTLTSLLSLTELESIRENIKLEVLNVNNICEDVFKIFETHSSNKSLNFNLNLNKQPLKIKINSRLLRESLSQLLKNAETYTEMGFISLTTYIKEISATNDRYCVIEISDTGLGIPDDKKNLVFEEFRQASEGVGREFEGTGLGLTLTKKYVELMGGEIELSSQLNNGTTVSLFFPLVDEDNELSVSSDKVYIKQDPKKFDKILNNSLINILIIEDEDINRIFLEKCISKIGKYNSLASGTEAIKAVSSCFYDLILMDINLGNGPDGIQTTQKIRKLSCYKKIPIVAMTAYADPDNIEGFLNNGFTHHLAKPFLANDLYKLINSIISGK